jgi:hypothetical protein
MPYIDLREPRNLTKLPRGDNPPRKSNAMDDVCAELEALGRRQGEWLSPNPRPGMNAPAEQLVEGCLSALQALPNGDRIFADKLMDVIAQCYLKASSNDDTITRRTTALLRISAQGALG